MAVGKRLKVRRSIRFAGVVAVVIVAHALALQWLDEALGDPPPLKAMADPMFTRVLQPQEPPPVVAAAEPAAPPPRTRALVPARKASAPQRAASKPVAPPPETVAAAEPPAAPAPESAASAPEQAAPAQAAASAPLAAASAAGSGSLDTWPVDTRLSYLLTGYYRGDLTGFGRVQWQRQQDRYQVRVDLDFGLFGFGFMSQGEVAPESLMPRAYQEQWPNRTRVLRIEPDTVVLNDGRTVARPGGVQDTASQFVELAHRFATGRAKLEVGGFTEILLARPGGVDLWVYDIVARETIHTPHLGAIEAFHLKPRPITRPRGPYTAEIWYAPSLQYLPVRIRVNMGTEAHVDLVINRIEQR